MDFDPYETWLGIPADRRPRTYYDLLGLASHEPDRAVIEIAALRRIGKVRLHKDDPQSGRIEEVLALLARARTTLMDSDLRAEYDAEQHLARQGRSGGESVSGDTAIDVVAIAEPEPASTVPEDFGSLVITEAPGDGSLRVSAPSVPRSSWLKKAFVYSLMLGSHALLLGSFLLYVSYKSDQNWNWPWSDGENADAPKSTSMPTAPTGALQNSENGDTWDRAVSTRSAKQRRAGHRQRAR